MKNSTTRATPTRLLAIGDIHGCLKQLKALLKKVEPTPSDQIIFLGDYVDRGPDSAGVIDYLIEFSRTFPASIFLRGNHEQMFVDYLEEHDSTMFLMNGGHKTLDSYRQREMWPVPQTHRSFLQALHHYYAIDDYIFVHAGLRPGIPVTAQDNFDLLWIRQEFIGSGYDWGQTVVYGHTPLEEPFLGERRIGLDTGCVYGRFLSCCDVLTREIWQA